ncbi:MAG: hypothetical protein Kow0047_14410 [Anaerolineae bacterium]
MKRWLWIRRLIAWDHRVSQRWQEGAKGHLHAAAILGAHLGDGWLWIGFLALLLLIGSAEHRALAWRWAAAMALAGGITTSLKFVWRRQRPRQRSGFYSQTYDKHSFPSGHATRMGTVAVFLPALFPQWGWIVWPLIAWVGWSRVALGVHYLLDVVTGFVLGAIIAFVLAVV